MREAGLGIDALELINSPMSLSQIYEFCDELFALEKDSMRHPRKDWDGFITDLKKHLHLERLVWNPIKKQLSPWIDLDKLESIYDKSQSQPFKPSARVSPDAASAPKKTTSFHERVQTSHRRRVTVSDCEHPSATLKSNSFNQSSGKQHVRRHTEFDVDDNKPPSSFRRSASGQEPPESRAKSSNRMPQKAKSFHGRKSSPTSKKQMSFHDPFKSSVVIKEELFESLFGVMEEKPDEGKLGTLIKEWSHNSNGKLRPLHELLFEAPVLMPPNNPLVKHHEYFDKWKVLHRDAFQDEDGTSDGVVQKVARRCKIFLHPDKWPSDLCDDQKFLLQSMWDVFQESELF